MGHSGTTGTPFFSDNSTLGGCPSFNQLQTYQTSFVSVLFLTAGTAGVACHVCHPLVRRDLVGKKQAKVYTLQVCKALESVLLSLENYTFRTTVGKPFPEFPDPDTAGACGHDMHFEVLPWSSYSSLCLPMFSYSSPHIPSALK